MLAQLVEHEPAGPRRPGDLLGDEHVARRGERRHAGGDVDSGAEEVPCPLDRRTAVDPHPHGWVARAGQRMRCDAQAGGGGLGGVADANHHRVAERLHDVGILAELGLDAESHAPRELRRARVALELGQRREAGDVGEHEGRRARGRRVLPPDARHRGRRYSSAGSDALLRQRALEHLAGRCTS